MFGYEKVKIWR